MIIVHSRATETGFDRHLLANGETIPPNSVWIDLLEPTRAEDLQVEAAVGIEIPTREETRNIEPSELIYAEDGARFMTARILCQSGTETPKLAGVTFILKDDRLITVRYDEPRSFQMFVNRIARPGACQPTGSHVLLALFETVIDRAAEILRLVGERIDELSASTFNASKSGSRNPDLFRSVLQTLGLEGDRISKVRESLVSIERMLLFLSADTRDPAPLAADLRSELRTTLRDLQSLEDHASFLAGKIQFLLDAVLGLVSLEQNNIVKIFSVLAVIFMPPTLVASIYGMNFKIGMWELEWQHGYAMALSMMVCAAILPYLFFKWKKWL